MNVFDVNELFELEKLDSHKEFIFVNGKNNILISAPHTMKQIKEDGTIKKAEPFTKAIALYLAKELNLNAIVKIKDTGDSNHNDKDNYKDEILKIIKEKNIKLFLDLHGASINNDFDIELGTLNNITADFSTINELKESFTENGINNISISNKFKGGKITQSVFFYTNCEAIQIEINSKYRDYNNFDNIIKLIECLKKFIKFYLD